MSQSYTEDQVIATVALLTRVQLAGFVQARIVTPLASACGPVFRQIDIARLELLCDLSDQFDLKDDGLGVVIALVDQLHGVRADLRAVLMAIAAEPDDIRSRISTAARDRSR